MLINRVNNLKLFSFRKIFPSNFILESCLRDKDDFHISPSPIISNTTKSSFFLPCINVCNQYFIKNTYHFPYQKFHSSAYKLKSFRSSDEYRKNSRSVVYILSAIGVLVVGLSYAAVPLYRIFCQATSYGGTVQENVDRSKIEQMETVKHREINVRFTADSAAMVWNFRPEQNEVQVSPGETALAFYIAKNPTDRQVIGISTYNVLPFEAGQYFNKIQCFCFEEQMLNPGEEVHMPVFFYIDPEFALDPFLENVDDIVLSYTFFEAKEGMKLPLPGFMR